MAGELVSSALPNLIEDVLLGELEGLITRRLVAAELIHPEQRDGLRRSPA